MEKVKATHLHSKNPFFWLCKVRLPKSSHLKTKTAKYFIVLMSTKALSQPFQLGSLNVCVYKPSSAWQLAGRINRKQTHNYTQAHMNGISCLIYNDTLLLLPGTGGLFYASKKFHPWILRRIAPSFLLKLTYLARSLGSESNTTHKHMNRISCLTYHDTLLLLPGTESILHLHKVPPMDS